MKILRIGLLSVLIGLGIILTFNPELIAEFQASNLSGAKKKAFIESGSKMQQLSSAPNTVKDWPPKVGKPFPEVSLYDHNNAPFEVSNLRGKPTVIEFLSMTCAGCQAFSGGNTYGAFDNLLSQANLESIEAYFPRYTNGLELSDSRLNFVQLIIYNSKLETPTASDLAAWRKHFHFDRFQNTFILSGGKPLENRDSFVRIPGFLLLDKNLVVRYDSLGHRPIHNLYTDLLPAVPRLLSE